MNCVKAGCFAPGESLGLKKVKIKKDAEKLDKIKRGELFGD